MVTVRSTECRSAEHRPLASEGSRVVLSVDPDDQSGGLDQLCHRYHQCHLSVPNTTTNERKHWTLLIIRVLRYLVWKYYYLHLQVNRYSISPSEVAGIVIMLLLTLTDCHIL